MGFSWIECYNIPIWQRMWFIHRLNKEIKDSQNGGRSAHHNTGEARELMGRQRGNVPAKLRRFT